MAAETTTTAADTNSGGRSSSNMPLRSPDLSKLRALLMNYQTSDCGGLIVLKLGSIQRAAWKLRTQMVVHR
ncbi:unnamed protein product [Fusarium graminearum]|nr:unnamed protein product [Fusarium graminearum]